MLCKKRLALAVSMVLSLGNTLLAQAEVTVEQLPLTGPAAATPSNSGVQTQAAPRPAAIDSTPLDTSTNSNANASANASGTAGGGNGGSPSWDLYQQVQTLQGQMEQMQGTIEEQAHTIDRLQNEQKAQYKDLDQRLNTLNGKITQLQQAPTPAPAASSAAPAEGSAAMPVANIEEEKNAYLSAYNIFRTQGPDQAIPPMLTFVSRFPNSTFAPNAYYWLGEFYLAASTPDLASSERNFETVLKQYPDNAKAPAALYKLGMIADQQGKADLAKKRMQDVLSRFPNSPEAALATSYLKPAPVAATPKAEAKSDAKAKTKTKANAKPKKKAPSDD